MGNGKVAPFKGWRNKEDASGSYEVFDRLGRPLQPGDRIMLHDTGQMLWEVQEVTPILGPESAHLKGPACRLGLAAAAALPVAANTPIVDVIKVQDVSEYAPRGPQAGSPDRDDRADNAPTPGGVES